MTSIYHITSMRNLTNILKEGGLWRDRLAVAQEMLAGAVRNDPIKLDCWMVYSPGTSSCSKEWRRFYYKGACGN